jgi:DNA polymerase-3 subunit delta'
MAERRVILIDAAEDMERGAANALLKNLEEPPRNTVFLLISHAPGRLLPTIRSRCRFLPFSPLNAEQIHNVLSEVAADLPPADRLALIRNAHGAPGRALAMRALNIAALDTALGRIAQTGDPTQKERIALTRALAPKSAQARYEAFLEFVPHYIARRMRDRRSIAETDGIEAWTEAVALAQGAMTLSLDPSATIFALCGSVARLAPRPE